MCIRDSDERVEQAEGCERDRRDVVGEGPDQVAANGAQSPAGQCDRVGNDVEALSHQDDVGGLHRHVGAADHRQAQVGGRECGRVVDPVADHRHPSPGRLQPFDDGRLVGRCV